jgi:hypothetical protein
MVMDRSNQRKALELLLADEDESTRALTMAEIRAHPEVWRDAVESWLKADSPRLRESARAIYQAWHPARREASGAAPDPAAGIRSWEALESFCWLMCKIESPGLNESGYRHTLDAWARRVAALSGPHPTPSAQAAALREALAGEVGLQGNRSDYYAPSNSYLNRVMETRMGIPLSLSLLYVFTARRAGWEAWGVNTPGHYLMAVGDQVLDPYFGGSLQSPEVLAERFGMPLATCSLPGFHRATPADTAQRMLANLLNSYMRQGDSERCLRIRAYLDILQENAS